MSLSVLVVDDVQDWRNMLVGLMRDIYPNATIFSAVSVEEAKQCLQENHIDLAVLDVRLDELDEDNVGGLLLMEHIGDNFDSVQTIIITGYASIDRVKRSLRPNKSGRRPAVDFIEKSNIHVELLPRLRMIMSEGK